ncbi:MAG: DNA recombination protein RmuC [Flavobacteriales bacterium]|jgi:DNA recombination protein RmuC|nr:DNA recombination protein RmuC [Flavobacteriales bacterium]MBP7449464.1 DNA recombination protein RmuC [Flavobacteriales bacterium]
MVGLLAGVLAALYWKQGQESSAVELLKQEHGASRSEWEHQVQEERTVAEDRMREVVRLSAAMAAEQERGRGLEHQLERQRTELEQLQVRMTTEFEHIADRLLLQRGKELQEQHQNKLGDILKPLQERILEFQHQVRDAYDKEGRERFALKGEIVRLVEQNQRLSQDASDLTKALKGDSQAQGAWGEMILERILEGAGLVKGQEYSMQTSTTLADGSRLRPDAVVMLPEDKHLIIDSKVSLVHYERWAAATDEAERNRLLKLHVESMRTHAKGLGDKDYTKLYGVKSVDFVLMFIPVEPAFLLALRERPEVFQEAYDRQVVMVTHSTLMATLRTVHGIWKHERIARNHLAIADRAGALYEKFVGFTEDLGRIGKHVNDAKDSYEKALSKLSEGPGNLVRQVEMLKELGARTNKGLHDKLLQRSLENGE